MSLGATSLGTTGQYRVSDSSHRGVVGLQGVAVIHYRAGVRTLGPGRRHSRPPRGE
jgi:hypothetical protein